jgi:hypothetical protein
MSIESFDEFWYRHHCYYCQNLLTTGTVHGCDCAAEYSYCFKCDKFVSFNSIGFTAAGEMELKQFIKVQLLEAAK